MVIVRDLILKWGHLGTCVTRGSFRSRHETAQQIFLMPYEAMKDRLITWGRDEAAQQMVLSFGYDMKRLPDNAYEALSRPAVDQILNTCCRLVKARSRSIKTHSAPSSEGGA